ncbi:C4-dicarboxylate ABC transporter [Oceanibaculum pacificum]|uniref:C4-dicarboxylate ABC transporter n=2 Tax=Oceanibaculum pacificum TaxID=580166 RepID=A0A154W333_9PROT|nr:C4-dicarboxylate ABC transporter [Oceanibaculum pacificum]
MKIMRSWIGMSALAAVLLGVTAGAGQAAEVKLRVADSFPVGHFIPKYYTLPFMEKVKAATGGKVDFEYYPAQQLGKVKDFLSLTQAGVADIAYIAPAFISDKMPLSGVVELPGAFPTSCAGTKAYWEVAKSGPLAKEEFAPNGVRLLYMLVNPPYQILSRNEIKGLDSLKGQKLRTAGGAMEIMARKLEVVPVRMAGPEIYESLSRGTMDGLVFPLPNLMEYDLQELVKYSTSGQNFGSFVHNFMINERKFQSLPKDVQAAMLKIGEEITLESCKQIDADVKPAIETLKKAGVTFVELPEKDKQALGPLLSGVGTEWAASLDKRGKPGTAVLEAFNKALKAQ